MPRLFAASLLAAAILLALGCSKSPQEKQQHLFNEAVKATNELDFSAAQEALNDLAELDAASPLTRFGSGYLFERQLQHYDALAAYVALTNTHPSFADAHAAAWRILTRMDMMPEALRKAESYREVLPHDGEAAIIMALAMINSGLPARAHRYLDSAVAEGADPAQAAMIHARAFILDDQPDAADSAYEAGLAGASSSVPVFVDAAAYLEAAGLIDSAVTISRKAVTLSKNDILQAQRHCELAIRHNYFAEADKVIAQFRADNRPEIVVSMLEAFRYNAAGLVMPPNEAIDRVIGLNGGTISTRMYESAIKTKEANEIVLLHNIETLSYLLVSGGYDPEFQEVVFYQLAVQAADWLRGKEALVQWEQVRPLFRNRPHLAARHTWALFESGQFQAFDEAVAQIRRQHGRQADWLTELADVYADIILHEYDTAAATYARALELNPWYQPALTGWINMLRYLDRFDEAANLFDRYPHFAERFPALAMLEGICLVEAGQSDRGVQVYLMNAALNRGDEALHNDLFQALSIRAQVDAMRQVADWMMENAGENPHLLAMAAQLRLETGDNESALAAAEAALKVAPGLLDAKAFQARALHKMGDADGAIALLKANLGVDRYHIPSTYWLSRILAAENREVAQAQDLARRALFDSSQNLREWLNLSYVYLVTGRYDLARGEALKMSRSFAGEPGPLFYLGMALYHENKTDEARKRLQEAIDSGLAGSDLTEAHSVLTKLKS